MPNYRNIFIYHASRGLNNGAHRTRHPGAGAFIEDSCSRARHNEGSEAAPQCQVRPRALLCKACGPAAALLPLLLAAALIHHRGDRACCSQQKRVRECINSPFGGYCTLHHSSILQLRLATTDPLFGEGHHSNGCIQMIAFKEEL
jgi:hypothetical protein